ncbi:hypothetical protein NZD89_20310 [Alicyclobacillus fastidiosus]|uniref:Uncharacterized protein n=1 Tax=Alicyclobacillus fastidiosus TaxID=392011 RepID=A0ABY6ZCX2_9BACL|nr:hypothetical protein [Alicyclobacillus fastidiosus]WAH40633.1 hypothetical protein NZD89_20310 [Alicyclobacillus fastidiosus]GMA62080.1 hypothetical protein GCM10025859_25200 [Alicyclobacillus fastidiosus]
MKEKQQIKQVFNDLGSQESGESPGEAKQLDSELRRRTVVGAENEVSKYVIVSVLPFPHF